MYFSGQMLDEYSRHLEVLKPTVIAEVVSDDADPVDKARMSFAGIVTSVTQKTTRNGERMAFFTLEDRVAEIECLVFPRQYEELAYHLRTDAAIYVSGSISLREDEPPKLLVNRIEPLCENARFNPEQHRAAVKEQDQGDAAVNTAKESMPQAAQRTVASSSASNQQPQATPRRLFLRVPDCRCELYHKALNLVELFDGGFPVFFFFADERRYEVEPHGVALSDYVLRELRMLLGEENVILK